MDNPSHTGGAGGESWPDPAETAGDMPWDHPAALPWEHPEDPTRDLPAELSGDRGGSLGRELAASILLVMLMLATTVMLVGGVLGAVWLFA